MARTDPLRVVKELTIRLVLHLSGVSRGTAAARKAGNHGLDRWKTANPLGIVSDISFDPRDAGL